ncbi:MAG: MFS transporter [Nevskiaceae bacterium]|nr:MAG: MFS transporter [Nevskiaceae bacterium]TBR74020.1 MAG: MFS transporter [Nevskiaceae bacterium]
MYRSLRSAIPLLLSTVFLLMGSGLLHTLIAVSGDALGFSLVGLGALTAAYYTGFLAGTFIVPRLTHRIGHIRAFAFCTAIVAVLVLLQALAPSYGLWFVTRLLQGVLLVGLYTLIESWLNATQTTHRSAIFTIYMMLNLGAGAAAQQFMTLDREAFVLFGVIAIMVCVASLPVVLTRQPEPRIKAIPGVRVRRLYEIVPIGIVGALISGLLLGALWGLLPVYAYSSGLDAAQVGTYMMVAIGGGVALQWPLGRLSDCVDRSLALGLVALIAAGVALVNFIAVPVAGCTAYMCVFVLGGLCFSFYPITVAHVVDYLQREELLWATGTVLFVHGLGSAIGPLLAGSLMGRAGASWLFIWFAVLCALLSAYALHRYIWKQRQLRNDRHFVPMVQSASIAMDLHPDTEPQGPYMEDLEAARD